MNSGQTIAAYCRSVQLTHEIYQKNEKRSNTEDTEEILMTLLQPRDESTMAMVGSELYIMGGIGAHTVFLPIIKILFLIIIVTRIIRE